MLCDGVRPLSCDGVRPLSCDGDRPLSCDGDRPLFWVLVGHGGLVTEALASTRFGRISFSWQYMWACVHLVCNWPLCRNSQMSEESSHGKSSISDTEQAAIWDCLSSD